MALDKSGRYHMNPQVARMHDAAPKTAFPALPKINKISDAGEQEDAPKGHVELHHGPSPKDGKGQVHTIHHFEDGREPEFRGHESLHEAHHAINDHMGEDGCAGGGECSEHSNSKGEEPTEYGGESDEDEL